MCVCVCEAHDDAASSPSSYDDSDCESAVYINTIRIANCDDAYVGFVSGGGGDGDDITSLLLHVARHYHVLIITECINTVAHYIWYIYMYRSHVHHDEGAFLCSPNGDVVFAKRPNVRPTENQQKKRRFDSPRKPRLSFCSYCTDDDSAREIRSATSHFSNV